MENLHIEPSDDSPMIIGNVQKGTLEISGKSLPEDVSAFYTPVLNWLEEYAENPKNTTISFKLTYFNTASSKLILDLFLILENIKEAGYEVKVTWYYPIYDEEMHEAGIEYSEMVDIDFEWIPWQPGNNS
jgi:hypothetical protein